MEVTELMNAMNLITSLSGKKKKTEKTEDWGLQFVILQRGWVFVGRMKKTGHQCVLENASNVRSWGTSAGLGELADSGPLSATKLDRCKAPVRFHYLTTIACLECNPEKWKL